MRLHVLFENDATEQILPPNFDGFLYKVQLGYQIKGDNLLRARQIPGYTFITEPNDGMVFSRRSTYRDQRYAMVYKMKAPDGLLYGHPTKGYELRGNNYYNHRTDIKPGWFKAYSGGEYDMAIVTVETEMILHKLYDPLGKKADISKGVVHLVLDKKYDAVFGLTDHIEDDIRAFYLDPSVSIDYKYDDVQFDGNTVIARTTDPNHSDQPAIHSQIKVHKL
jgi:hypothetical protein